MDYGYCKCGCGLKTRLAPYTHGPRGWKKGLPLEYIHGHNGKKIPEVGRAFNSGYIKYKNPRHPRADSGGYVMEHIVIVEGALGKFLPTKAEVHHIDGDRSNNNPNNLVVCEDRAYHALLHKRESSLKACGHANWLKCIRCYNYDDPKNLTTYKLRGTLYAYHHKCMSEYNRRRYQSNKVTKEEFL